MAYCDIFGVLYWWVSCNYSLKHCSYQKETNYATEVRKTLKTLKTLCRLSSLNLTPQLLNFSFVQQGVAVTFFSYCFSSLLTSVVPTEAKSRSARALWKKGYPCAISSFTECKKWPRNNWRQHLVLWFSCRVMYCQRLDSMVVDVFPNHNDSMIKEKRQCIHRCPD